MGLRYLFDTNIFLAFLSGDIEVKKLFSKEFVADNEIFISVIVKMELLSYPGITRADELIIRDMVEELEVIPLDDDIEALAVALRRKYRLKLPDAIIAASAVIIDSILVSKDKDFEKVSEVSLYAFH
jgi:predicted nucleic acid-binding protein